MNIIFRKQVHDYYSPAACIQMLTNTEQNQQDIYFRMLRVLQSIKPADCASKAKFQTITHSIIGQKEKFCKLFEETLNYFRTDDIFWDVQVGVKFEKYPALAILYPQKNKMNQMLKGHPIIISKIENEKLTVYDPANEDIVQVLKIRLNPFVSSYYNLFMVHSDGAPVE